MRSLDDRTPQFDLTYSDVFPVPTFSNVGSRMSVGLTPPEGIGTTLPIVVADMTAVAALAANKVVTLLLLLMHGAIDNNGPPGESEQMYTVLRVLGEEVGYIRNDDELHWILQYDRRKRWSESVVAWFDKQPRNDAAWWGHLWPEGG